jgi:hypothetical protein
MYYTFNCPKCDGELTAEVDVGEHLVDWDEECEHCKYKFTSNEVLDIFDEALEDCHGSMCDYAVDMLGDR